MAPFAFGYSSECVSQLSQGYKNGVSQAEKKGICLSKATIHKYMNQEMKLYSVVRRKKPGYKKGTPHKIYPNLLKQDFVVHEPNRVWCTDFTYLYLANGTVRYNCTIIDLYDRSVVASENGKYITADLAIDTLNKAIHDFAYIWYNQIRPHSWNGYRTPLEFRSKYKS